MSQLENFLQLVLTDAGRFIVGLVSWGIFYLYRNRNTWLYSILDWRSRMGCKVRISRARILSWKLLPGTRTESGAPYYLYEARVRLDVKNVQPARVAFEPSSLLLRADAQKAQSSLFLYPPPGIPPLGLDPKGGARAQVTTTLTVSSGEIDGDYQDAPFYPEACDPQLGPAWFSVRLASPSPACVLHRGSMRQGSIQLIEPGVP